MTIPLTQELEVQKKYGTVLCVEALESVRIAIIIQTPPTVMEPASVTTVTGQDGRKSENILATNVSIAKDQASAVVATEREFATIVTVREYNLIISGVADKGNCQTCVSES